MNKLIGTAVAVAALTGCGHLSKADLGKVMAANDAASGSAYSAATTNGAAREATNASYTGTVTGTGSWTGSVDVDGALTTDDSGNGTWALKLTYNDVTYDNYTLNGDVNDTLTFASGSGAASFTYELSGTLDVTGDATGSADFDYTTAASVDMTTGGYSYTYTGTINGEDASSISVSGS